jgi:hypothetical protein
METVANTNEKRIKDEPYWWFTLVTTADDQYISRWKYGEHISKGNSQHVVGLKWFIQA